MQYYQVHVHTPDGLQTFSCADDEYILDAAENAGIDLPYSCRAGACSACTGKVISGTLNQSDQSFLDEKQIAEGYALLCVSYATSELTIETGCEEDLWEI